MRNKSKVINKAVLAVICTVAVCVFLLNFVDDGLNGAAADWIYNNFMMTYDTSYGDPEIYHTVTEPNWVSLKSFIIAFFVVSSAAVSLLVVFISSRSARKKEIATISYISEAMKAYMKQEDVGLELPKEYAEIESQLIQSKNREQEHLALLEKESQQKNDLITYLAHDLKTPLASVIGYLSLLDEVRDMPEEQREKYTGVALDKAYRLEELIDEFFDITRFNLHSIELSMGRVDLYFLLQQLAEQFYPILSQQNKEVEIHSPEDTMVWADGDKLARAFNNILKNAIAYSYENTVIRIFVEIENHTVIVRFINKGNPIPPHKLETIFEKFYRLDTSRSTNMGGAGLGLAIAKQIVTAHRGEILASSSKENTVFTVVLPEALIHEEE